MNINPVAIITKKLSQKSNFKSRHISNHASDSFERSTNTPDTEIDYPRILHSSTQPRRKRTLASEERKYAKKLEQQMQRQQEVKKEFIALDSRIEKLLTEVSCIVYDDIGNLHVLKKEISNASNNPEKRKRLAEMYIRKALQLEEVISELEEAQKRIDEFYASGMAKSANIPDLRINLSPENMEYYRELINFNPYSLID